MRLKTLYSLRKEAIWTCYSGLYIYTIHLRMFPFSVPVYYPCICFSRRGGYFQHSPPLRAQYPYHQWLDRYGVHHCFKALVVSYSKHLKTVRDFPLGTRQSNLRHILVLPFCYNSHWQEFCQDVCWILLSTYPLDH